MNNKFKIIKFYIKFLKIKYIKLFIGDWGLGIGDW
jgi:hypothetical protein